MHSKTSLKTDVVVALFFVAVTILPISVFALSLADVFGALAHAESETTLEDRMATMAVLSPSQTFIAKERAFSDTEVSTTDHDALVPVMGPAGTSMDIIEEDTAGTISIHRVQAGESIGSIAKLYNVKTATIRINNGLSAKDSIKPGQDLLILPVDGLEYTVQKGDTIKSVAKKFGGTSMSETDLASAISDIAIYNDIEETASLVVGKKIIIPGADQPAEATSTTKSASKKSSGKMPPPPSGGGKYQGGKDYFKRAWGGRISQGFHDKYRAKDYAMPIGSTIGAAAGGTVISTITGWGGGYGNYIVLKHDNGTQTLYAHLSQIKVSVGQQVSQGETIGLSGNTGRSTGPHLHFEIRGGWGDIPF